MQREARELEQVLFVDPAARFEAVAAALGGLGWRREALAEAGPPLVPGEPELAAWSWDGGIPHVSATFNPVTRLRTLEVAEAPPALRAALAARLPLLGPDEALASLGHPDPRARLRGLDILVALERFDLVGQVDPLIDDEVAEVGEAAWAARERLAALEQAWTAGRRALAMVLGAALPMLRHLDQPELIEALRPGPEDVAAVFHPSVAEAMQDHYAALWRDPPEARGGEVEVFGAPAGMLRGPNALSRRFPGGYRDVAAWLDPRRVWLSWRTRAEGATLRYDGLVAVGERWVWLPKPWRPLGALVGDRLAPRGLDPA